MKTEKVHVIVGWSNGLGAVSYEHDTRPMSKAEFWMMVNDSVERALAKKDAFKTRAMDELSLILWNVENIRSYDIDFQSDKDRKITFDIATRYIKEMVPGIEKHPVPQVGS